MNSKRAFGRLTVYAALVFALAITAFPSNSAAAPVEQGRSRTFPETNQTVSGRFLEVWEGGRSFEDSLFINGLPLTDRHEELSVENGQVYQMQWFERARFEAHPENQAPYDVLLGRLGAYAAEGRTDAPFKAIENPGPNSNYVPETKHTVGDASEGGRAIFTFWQRMGGVPQFGYPLSQPFQEVTRETDPAVAGKSFLVQYFERQRFEYHPENKGTRFEVLLGRLGAEQMGQAGVRQNAVPAGQGASIDQLRIGMSQEPDNLFDFTTNLAVSSNVLAAMKRDLVETDAEGNRYPEIAYFVPTVDNGGAFFVGTGKDRRLVVKFKIRHGVKWDNGQPVTSNDVVFGYKLVLDPSVPVISRDFAQRVHQVVNPDAHTLVYNYLTANEAAELVRRDPDTYANLADAVEAGQPVVDPTYYLVANTLAPESAYGNVAPGELVSRVGRQPVGNGPYKFSRWEAGQFIELVINEHWASWNPAVPTIPRLRFNIVTDSNALLAQTQAGGHDIITSDALSLAQSPTLDRMTDRRVDYIPALVWEHLELNLESPKLNDVRVRQAIAYGINRQAVVDALLFGKTKVLHSWMTPSYPWSLDNPKFETGPIGSKFKLVRYEYNQARANQLLDQAGWVRGGDGIRSKGGVRLSLDWQTTNSQIRQDQTLAFQQDLAKVGVELKPTFLPRAADLFGQNGAVSTGRFDVAGFAYLSDPDPGPQGLFHSSQIPTEAGSYAGQNYFRWKHDRNDTLSSIVANSLSETERATAIAEQQVIVSQEVPFIGLYTRPNITVAPKGLQNYKPSNSLVPPTWNVEEWRMTR